MFPCFVLIFLTKVFFLWGKENVIKNMKNSFELSYIFTNLCQILIDDYIDDEHNKLYKLGYYILSSNCYELVKDCQLTISTSRKPL